MIKDNDIIKALECLTGGFNILCHECAFNGKFPCRENAAKAALDLIKHQQAEIERLKKLRELAAAEREANVKGFTEALNAIKSEAIKEFAEMVCEGRVSNDPVVIAIRCAVKEMTEGKDAGKDI